MKFQHTRNSECAKWHIHRFWWVKKRSVEAVSVINHLTPTLHSLSEEKKSKLTNPQSKSRTDLGFSLKSDSPTTHAPPPPEKVSNKQERGIQPKQKLLIYLNRVQLHFWRLKIEVWSLSWSLKLKLKFEVWSWLLKLKFGV